MGTPLTSDNQRQRIPVDEILHDFIEGGEVTKKILKHLGLWTVKPRPPPRSAKSQPLSTEPHIDYSDSHVSPSDNGLVITVDLQGHGRTADIPERPLSIEQYAKDVVGLLKYLGISKADFFGDSYGANTAAMIAIRYPELVGRIATCAATFGPPQVALDH